MDHLIENSKDLGAQFTSPSIKLQHFILSCSEKAWLGRCRQEHRAWWGGSSGDGRREEGGGRREEGGGGGRGESRASAAVRHCTPAWGLCAKAGPLPSPGNVPFAYFLLEAAGKDRFCSESVLAFEEDAS